MIALIRLGTSVDSPSAKGKVDKVTAVIRDDPAVSQVDGFYNTGNRAFVSTDGQSTYLAVQFKPLSSSDAETAAKRIESSLKDEPGVSIGGNQIAGVQIGKQVGKDLGLAEGLAFPILFVLLFLIFRSLVSALLPLIGGAVAILATFLGLRLVNSFTPLSIFALNLTTGLGLGLAIDYNLFIVSRFREEVARGGAGIGALTRTLQTAGRTAAFSGLTVAAALASLLVFPQPFLYSMGIGGIFVALFSVLAAIVVLPAILALLGTRVNAGAPKRFRRSVERSSRPAESGFWFRLSHAVMRRPIPVALGSAALMIALGIPALSPKFTGVDARALPESASARQVDDALRTEFPPNRTSPIYVGVEAPQSAESTVAAYRDRLRSLPNVETVSGPRPSGPGLWRVDVISRTGDLAGASQTLVRDVRAVKAGFPALVGGTTAAFVDEHHSIGSNLRLCIVVLVATTLILLFAMTGSVILPIKSLLMNLLTLSATFGILVLVFQDGRLESVLGYTSVHALDLTQPILVGVIAFALSTDYGVFLLTRIKELHDRGASNTEAVAGALERTGRLITSAAFLFCIAVGAFSTSKITFIKELGFGMAVAVIIDATIVRGLLVPSLMRLLGDWNWWAPGPLRRLYDRYGIHETAAVSPAAVQE